MRPINFTNKGLWTKFRNGDDEALTLIYSENSPRLYLYGLKLTSNHSIVEDVIQDLFSELIRTRKNLGDTDNIQFYLIKSFKRRLQRALLKEKRYTMKENVEDYIFEITYSVEQNIILEETSNQRISLIRKALDDLTSRQEEAIYLKFNQELEYDEIAEMLEMSIEGCRNLIYRAIKSLKDSFHGDNSILLFFLHTLI